MGTDRYAYVSRLRGVEPTAKLLLMLAGIAVCLALGSAAVDCATAVLFCALNVRLGGIRARSLARLLRLPLGFIAVASLTAVVGAHEPGAAGAVLGLRLGGAVYGVDAVGLTRGGALMLRAAAVISCAYFFALNTPVTDFTAALRRLRVPGLFIELTELTYRFIFVLSDTAARIRTAQTARLGYRGVKTSYRSLGTLVSMVFLRAYRKSDRVYDALVARGYGGALDTVGRAYESGRAVWTAGACAVAAQLAVWGIVRFAL